MRFRMDDSRLYIATEEQKTSGVTRCGPNPIWVQLSLVGSLAMHYVGLRSDCSRMLSNSSHRA